MAQYRDGGVGICLPTLAMDGAVHQPRTAKSLTLTAMSLGFGVVQLDVTIVNTALNSYRLNASAAGCLALQWVVDAYTDRFRGSDSDGGRAWRPDWGEANVYGRASPSSPLASIACAFGAKPATCSLRHGQSKVLGAATLVPNSLALSTMPILKRMQRGRAVRRLGRRGESRP